MKKKDTIKKKALIIQALALVLVLLAVLAIFTACDETAITVEANEAEKTMEVTNNLTKNQPTPTDINYSLERYNLIRRAYWVNGQREKANSLICEIEKPLGYIVLFTEGGATVGSFIVDGKVSSLNSYLSPDSEVYEIDSEATDWGVLYNGTKHNDWLADVDGSYGENDAGIFFFTPDGKYVEWTGIYLYSDIPFEIDNPVVKIAEE